MQAKNANEENYVTYVHARQHFILLRLSICMWHSRLRQRTVPDFKVPSSKRVRNVSCYHSRGLQIEPRVGPMYNLQTKLKKQYRKSGAQLIGDSTYII
jgi:hypothetical protein